MLEHMQPKTEQFCTSDRSYYSLKPMGTRRDPTRRAEDLLSTNTTEVAGHVATAEKRTEGNTALMGERRETSTLTCTRTCELSACISMPPMLEEADDMLARGPRAGFRMQGRPGGASSLSSEQR